jgi:non-heme Fe2+,alpha-ketoglutarate-dependent halogenase
MHTADGPILTRQQLAEYEEFGVIHSIPILSAEEVTYYRVEVEKTCRAIGDGVTRLDALHLFFRWAWDLSTHPRLLNCLEYILGPEIVLKSTRIFYKHANSTSYVGWHQDGVTERLNDGRAPAIWLGLTPATVENGCLRVVPRSHRLGLLEHVARPIRDALDKHNLAHKRLRSRSREAELSGKVTIVPTEAQAPLNLVMRPGEMSIHHPAILHGSNANRSSEPRIGLSASYSSPDLYDGTPVVWARGGGPRDQYHFQFIDQSPTAPFAEAVAAYRASDFQILFA